MAGLDGIINQLLMNDRMQEQINLDAVIIGLLQARYVLRDFNNKQHCGFDKLAKACEQAATLLSDMKEGNT